MRARLASVDRIRLSLAGITVVAAAVRFFRIGYQSFEHDELITVGLLHRSLWGMLSAIPHSESTPPVYYVVAWVWARIFGYDEAGLRSLSALFGIATVVVAYFVGRDALRSRVAGLATAALAAGCPILVWFSQEARSYSLVTLLCGLSLVFLVRALDDYRSSSLWWWSACSAVAVATHYFAGFLVVGEAAILVWRLRRRAIAPLAPVAVVAAALVPLAHRQYGAGGQKWNWFQSYSVGARLWELAERFVSFNYNPAGKPLIAFAILAVAALAVAGARVGRAAMVLGLAIWTIAAPVLLTFVGIDVFNYRNLLVAWLPLIVAGVAGLTRLPPRLQAAIVAVAALGLVGASVMDATRVNLQRGSWRAAARMLSAEHGPRVIMPVEVMMLTHYWHAPSILPPAGAHVSEVEVLGQGIAGPTDLGLNLRGFRLIRRERAGNITIYQFRAPRPELVTGRELPWQAVLAS